MLASSAVVGPQAEVALFTWSEEVLPVSPSHRNRLTVNCFLTEHRIMSKNIHYFGLPFRLHKLKLHMKIMTFNHVILKKKTLK